MPEGPEVRRLVDQLQQYVNYGMLTDVRVMSGRYIKKPLPGLEEFLPNINFCSGATAIKELNCKGKFIWWKIHGLQGPWFLFSTLGMTGSYKKQKDKYSRIEFVFNLYDKGKFIGTDNLYYSDIRNFGTLKFINDERLLKRKLAELGPDMLSNPCAIEEWLQIAKKRRHRSIVNLLMEQKYVSGVGNIYKSESLYLARLDPRKKVYECSNEELIRLYESVKIVLTNAYELGGSTIRNYKDLYGEEGKYAVRQKVKFNHAQDIEEPMGGIMVYDQKVDPLGNMIEKTNLDDGRSTYWVPKLQK